MPFPLAGLALDVIELVLDHASKIRGGAAEFSQNFAQRARKLWQFLRAKDHERDKQNDDPVGKSEQIYSLPSLPGILVTGAESSSSAANPYDILFARR